MAARIIRLPKEEFKVRGYHTERTPFFSLKAKSNGGRDKRIAVIAGKAVHKSAAKRNFLKRVTREALSRTAVQGEDLLLILSHGIVSLPKKKISLELRKAAKSLHHS